MKLLLALGLLSGTLASAAELKLLPTGEKTLPGFVEIVGVEAGPFDPVLWQAGHLNLLPDVRSPLLEPLPGKFRNIYAPSVVEDRDGWRVFYGAWDGVPTGNDRIYSVSTKDFLRFDHRQTIIEHGLFQHVCNVTAVRGLKGGFDLVCTAYPDAHGLNKPAFFASPDGRMWNGSLAPYTATTNDLVQIHDYEPYAAADINGMNVLFRESDRYRLYFANFKDFGRIYRASGTNGKDFQFEGVALSERAAVNDVKKFLVGDTNWYLMGLHLNGDQTWFSLSTNGLNFSPRQLLFTNSSAADRYIVAVGWVTQGDAGTGGSRLLGVLYGAGAVPTLDHNRIFARWLQPRLLLTTRTGQHIAGTTARGPTRQLIPTEPEGLRGDLRLYDEGGSRLLGEARELQLEAGRVYQLKR